MTMSSIPSAADKVPAHGDDDDEMARSTLELLFVTFNCAKNLINPAIFANHLHGALVQNSTGLPDLVAFSLQEVAPLSYSFMGSYFLSRYYTPYEEALNAAATRVLTASTTPSDATCEQSSFGLAPSRTPPSSPYTLVRANNVGMTALLLFAHDPAAVHDVQDAVVGFGVQDMGNKGAVGLRATWEDNSSGRSTEVTFVATHLAAMEWNLKKRNANWRSIVSGLTFGNPKDVLPGVFPAVAPAMPEADEHSQPDGVRPPSPASASSSEGSEEEEDDALLSTVEEESSASAPLLRREPSSLSRRGKKKGSSPPGDDDNKQALTPAHLSTLQDISIFKPTSHLFLAGDLNYRISSTSPPPQSLFPSFYVSPSDPRHWSQFLPRDQLTAEREAGRTMNGLSEAKIKFGPSYKYDVLSSSELEEAENAEMVREQGEVPWKWAPHRWPSWCDRVLYLDVPPWVRRRSPEQDKKVDVLAYDILPLMASSDHRAVYLRARVPVLGREEMVPPPLKEAEVEVEDVEGEGAVWLEEGDRKDPRITLPVPVDPHAWERRAAARRREVLAGWSMFLWATKEGAGLIGMSLLVAGATWWLWRVL